MLVAIVVAAQWIIRKRLDQPRPSPALSIGFLAMGLVLIADLIVEMWLRGMSATEVFLNHDPVSGTAYYVSLVLFAVTPAILARHRSASCRQHLLLQNSG